MGRFAGTYSINFVRIYVFSTLGELLACLFTGMFDLDGLEKVSHWTQIIIICSNSVTCADLTLSNAGNFTFFHFGVQQAQTMMFFFVV